jgi:hypothetical protein
MEGWRGSRALCWCAFQLPGQSEGFEQAWRFSLVRNLDIDVEDSNRLTSWTICDFQRAIRGHSVLRLYETKRPCM